MAEAVALGDRDMAGQHHEHAGSGLAGLEQHFAVLVTPEFAEPAHARDFLRRQRREGLLMARKRRRRRGAAIGLASSRGVRPFPLTSSAVTKAAAATRLFARLFPRSSCGDAIVIGRRDRRLSLRPRACDFRRLRFSRNASFSRSWRAFFAGSGFAPSRLSLSSFIVDLFECAALRNDTSDKPMSENHALAPLPQRTLDGWHRFVASGDHGWPPSVEHIVFRSPFVQSPIPTDGTLLVLTTVLQISRIFAITARSSQAPTTPRWNLPPISANGSSRASISSNSTTPAK